MSLYKASPNDRFILGFAMVCHMNVLVCCQNFGVDMFFLKLLVLTCFSQTCALVKKRGKLTSFGVDMFFLKLLVLTCVSQTRANQKIGKID